MKKTVFIIVLAAVLVFSGVSAYAIQGLDEDESTRILADDGYATLTTDEVGGSVSTTKEILLNDHKVKDNGIHVTDTYSVFSMDAAFIGDLLTKTEGSTVTFAIEYNSDKTKVTFTILDGENEVFAEKGRCVGELPYTVASEADANYVTMVTEKDAPVGISGYYPDASLVRWELMEGGSYTVKVNKVSFSDVPSSLWSCVYVEYLSSKGIINGKGNGIFDPEGSLTRAEFVTLLSKMSMDDIGNGSDRFTDVNAGDWYYEEVAWAAEAGITHGVGDNLFAPNNRISRQEVARMVMNFYQYMGIEPTPIRSAAEFTDQADIADWAVNEVAICQSIGVISGFPDGSFRPGAYASRGEAATMCSRMVSHSLILPQ